MRIVAERRLIHNGNIEQFGNDITNRHIRNDGNLQAVGSLVMAPAVAITKFPNAVAGAIGDQPAEALPEGHLAYMGRDVRSAISNLAGGVVQLKPGKVLKGAFDAADLITVDPLLDVGSAIFGHTRNKAQSVLSQAA